MNKEEPSSQEPTHYEVLGLNPLNPKDVTPDRIKKVYRKLAYDTHPERQFAQFLVENQPRKKKGLQKKR